MRAASYISLQAGSNKLLSLLSVHTMREDDAQSNEFNFDSIPSALEIKLLAPVLHCSEWLNVSIGLPS